jgi:hypothetical protein
MLQKLLPIVVLSVFIGLFDGVFSSGFAINSSAIRSLAGVKAVRVVAEELNPTMQKTGLWKEQLEGTAMEALRKNGFIVLGAQEPGKVPLVYVRLSSVFANDDGTGPVSFYITLQIKQPANLVNGEPRATPPQAKANAGEPPLLVTTWEGGTMAIVNREELFFYIKQTLLNLVGDLAHDHQEANTKQVSRSQ